MIDSVKTKFAKIVSNKYSKNMAIEVQSDFLSNYNKHVSRELIQKMPENIFEIAKLKKNARWYNLPKKEKGTQISLGIDETIILISKNRCRAAVIGSIASYDNKGKNST